MRRILEKNEQAFATDGSVIDLTNAAIASAIEQLLQQQREERRAIEFGNVREPC